MAFGTPVRLKQLTNDASGIGSLGGSGQKIIASAAIGDLVIAACGYGLATSPSVTVTDSQSNTWTSALIRADKTTGNTPHCILSYSILTTALASGTDYVTITFGSNVNFPVGLVYKTTPTSGTTVTTDGTNSATGVSTTPSAGSITTAGTDDFLAAFVCTGPTKVLTAGSGWTLFDSTAVTTNKELDGEYQIVSSATTYTGNGTIVSADWAMVVAGFKATASSTVYSKTGYGWCK